MKIVRDLFRNKRHGLRQQEEHAVEQDETVEAPSSDVATPESDTAPQNTDIASDTPQSQPVVIEPFVAAKNRVRMAHAGSDMFRSVLFFTTHKCASTFVTALLDELDAKSPYTNMNYEGAYWELGDEVNSAAAPIEEFLSHKSDMLFHEHGEIYGPIRKPIDFPNRKDFKHIFFFRDPRDVLVSMFFSFAYTHPEPLNSEKRAQFLEGREEMRAKGIDWFVLDKAKRKLLPRFVGYSNILKSARNPLILKYDEFSTETEAFLKKITNYLDVELSAESFSTLTEFASPVRNGAPELVHKRSGKSGQWKHEVKPETADKLTELLKPVLEEWGF